MSCTVYGTTFFGDICQTILNSIFTYEGGFTGGWFTSQYVNGAVAAVINYAQMWQQIAAQSSSAQALLDAYLNQLASNPNNDCLAQLEGMTGKSFSQIMTISNQTSFIDAAGPGGYNLTLSDFGIGVGISGIGDETLAQYFNQAQGAGIDIAVTPLGVPLVLLGESFYSIGTVTTNGVPSTLPTSTSFQQGTLFHELWHVLGVGDLGGSIPFDNWLQGGCQGPPPTN